MFFQLVTLLLLVLTFIVDLVTLIKKRKESEKRQFQSLLFFNFIGIITTLFVLCKVMYWKVWIQIQYLVFISFGITMILFVLKKFEIRKNFKEFVQKKTIIKLFALVTFIMVTMIPYSSVIYWNEIRRNQSLELNQENLIQKCHSYARYIWALRREGQFKKADKYENEKKKECRQINEKDFAQHA